MQVFTLWNRKSICGPIEDRHLGIFSLSVVLRLLNHQSLVGLYLWEAKSLITFSPTTVRITLLTRGGRGLHKGHK